MLPEEWSATDNFLSFWAIFYPYTPLLTPKIIIWKNAKNTWRYYPFTHVHHKQIRKDSDRFISVGLIELLWLTWITRKTETKFCLGMPILV